MARIIADVQPVWAIGENVRGFVEQPLGLSRSLSDLEGIGYSVVPFIIPACSVDALHRRDRVWIVAHADNARQPSGSWSGEDVGNKAGDNSRRSRESMADTKGERIQRHGASGEQESHSYAGQAIHVRGGEGRSVPFWEAEPDVGRVVDGIPDRVDRIKSLGNAVVAQVVEEIGRAILLSYENGSPVAQNTSDLRLPHQTGVTL